MTPSYPPGTLETITYSYWANASNAMRTLRRTGYLPLDPIRMLERIATTRPSERLAAAAGGSLVALRAGGPARGLGR